MHSMSMKRKAKTKTHLYRVTIKLLVEAPYFYCNKLLLSLSCIRDPDCMRDSASIKQCQLAILNIIPYIQCAQLYTRLSLP